MGKTDQVSARTGAYRPLLSARAAALLLALGVTPAFGLALGEADLRSFRGQPLEVRVGVSFERSEYVALDCFTVRSAPGRSNAWSLLPANRFRLEESIGSATLIIRTHDPINEQELALEVAAKCPGASGAITRNFQITLPPLAKDVAATPAASDVPMVIIQRPGEAPVTQLLGVPEKATPSAPQRSSRTWKVGKGESLDTLARGVYPKSAKLRAAFIARIREANSQALPGDKDSLPEGLVLNWPDLVALANASPKIDAPASQSTRTAQAEPRKPDSAPSAAKTPAKSASAPELAAVAPPAPKPGKAPAAQPAKVDPKPAAPTKSKSDSGFTLRLSGSDLDLSRSKGVSESTRAALREKQLLLDADDQVAALLSLRNTVKQLEGRLNDMQLKLATLPPAAVPANTKPEPPAAAKAPATPPPPTPNETAAPSLAATPPAETKAAETPKTTTAPAPAASPKAGDQLSAGSKDISPEDGSSPWWTSPYLAGGLFLLLLLIGLAIWARRKPSEAEQPEYLAPSSAGPLSGGPRSSNAPVSQDEDSIAHQFDDDLDRRFGETAQSVSTTARTSAPPAEEAGPRSAFRPQDTLRIHAPITQETEDEFFSTSLELDTRPATAIDFVLGDEAGEDKSRRQRYMEERFPELASRSISVDDPDSVIDAARHYYEESELQRASELLTYAFEERPGQLRFWLALFEIHRLEQRADDFLELAARFKNVHGGTDAWPKVQHIGRDLDPSQALYSAALGRLGVPLESDFDPVSENWLNVPMDFTSDVLMIELRQALLAEHGVDSTRLMRPLLEVS
jgi:pilus assembly protein FimV